MSGTSKQINERHRFCLSRLEYVKENIFNDERHENKALEEGNDVENIQKRFNISSYIGVNKEENQCNKSRISSII